MKINILYSFNFIYFFFNFANITKNNIPNNNLNQTIEQQKKLLENLKIFIKGIDDKFIEQWENQEYIASIKYLMNNNKNLSLNMKKFQQLYIKSLRLNPQYLELKIKTKKNALNFFTFIKNISISDEYKFTYDPKFNQFLLQMLGQEQEPREKYTEENSISFNINPINLFKDFFINIFNMYIDYYRIQLQEMELKINILTKLVNNITDYMNNNLMIIKIFIKILYLQDEIEFLSNLKENFNDEQILNKIQKLHKYLDKFFQYVENISNNEMNIKNMTAIEDIPYLFWKFNNKNLLESLNNQLQLFEKMALKKNKYKNFFNNIVKNFSHESLNSSKTFLIIHKILGYIKFNNNNLKDLIKKKKFINEINNMISLINFNYARSYSTDSFDSQQENFNRKDMLNWDKYKLKISKSISVSTNNVIDNILKSINDNYDYKKEIYQIKDKSINFYNQMYQLTKNFHTIERKILYLKNKIKLYDNKLNDSQDKAIYLVKNRQTNELEIKNHLLKNINTIIENNNKIKHQIILLYRFNILKIKD